MSIIRFERGRRVGADSAKRAEHGLFEALKGTLSGTALVTTDGRGSVTRWSEGACRMLGWQEHEALGVDLARLMAGEPEHDDLPDETPEINGLAYPTVSEGWCRRKDQDAFWARTTMAPFPDHDRGTQGHLVLVQDRTIQHADSERAQRDSQLLRSLLSSSRDAINILKLDGSPAGKYADLWPQPGCELFAGRSDPHPDGTLAFASARDGHAGQFLAATGANGSTRQWDVQVTPILGGDGLPVALLAVSRDVTQASQDAEQSKLVALEMTHRLKNVLCIVQAIASQTLRGPTMPADIRKTFETRLLAFFRTQDLLTRAPTESVGMHQMVDLIATLHCRRPSTRLRAEGPAVIVGPRVRLALSMVLNELGTNAIKYGALSSPKGSVDLAWQVIPGDGGASFRLTWTESGGPPVARPDHKGFGTRLIELSFPSELGFVSMLAYPRTGVVFTLECPMSALLQN